MLSPDRARRDRSPFSPHYTDLATSPVAARRSSLEERRRPAAEFGSGPSPISHKQIRERDEDDAHIDGESEGGDEEDEPGPQSPLLPIFSAEHLGEFNANFCHASLKGLIILGVRHPSCLQYHPHNPASHRTPLRNDSILGSAANPASIPIRCKAYSTANQKLSLLESYLICVTLKYTSIPERDTYKSRKQRCQSNACYGK